MLDISNEGIVSITRGDTFSSPLFINCGTELRPMRYNLKSYDTLYFAVMEPNQPFECAIIKKVYTEEDEKTTEGDIILRLNPSDTELLLPGKYFYTVKLKSQLIGGEPIVQTVVPERAFFILR